MRQEWTTLLDWFADLGRDHAVVAVAWSGGVDSSLAALAARTALGKGRAVALHADTALVPAWEREGLEEAARSLDLDFREVPLDILSVPAVAANGPDRCYHCKRTILAALRDRVGAGGLVADGTNADDDPARPGRRALAELGVRSPLAELDLTKSMVRQLAGELGLPMADRPSESCLATRLTGSLDPERLGLVARVEGLLRSRGVRDCRARLRGLDDELMMSVETPRADEPLVRSLAESIMNLIRPSGLNAYEWAERPGERA